MNQKSKYETAYRQGFAVINKCRAELAKLEVRKRLLEDEMRRWLWVRGDGETHFRREKEDREGNRQ